MKVAIESSSPRNVRLFANSYKQEFDNVQILEFNINNIYDLLLIDKPNIVIVDHLDHYIYESIFKDIDNNNINISTKFVVLNDLQNKYKHIKYKHIKYIPSNTYKVYNEYIQKQISEKFVLGVINCDYPSLNDKMLDILYPNVIHMPVRLINCPNYAHINNIGTCDENETLELISQCEIFINTNNLYLYDAIFLGKKIINIADHPEVQITNSVTIDTVKSATVIDTIDISKYKISNIVKYISN